MGLYYDHSTCFLLFQWGTVLIHRVLTYKDDPRAEGVYPTFFYHVYVYYNTICHS